MRVYQWRSPDSPTLRPLTDARPQELERVRLAVVAGRCTPSADDPPLADFLAQIEIIQTARSRGWPIERGDAP